MYRSKKEAKHTHTHHAHQHQRTHSADAVATVMQALKDRSFKSTDARKQVITAMHRAKTPMSIRDLASVVAVDEASVYRTVNLLLEEKLAESIALPDETFVFALKMGHHHHLICVSCNAVAHIDCDSEPRPKLRQTPFARIIDHDVTYYGFCRRCEETGV